MRHSWLVIMPKFKVSDPLGGPASHLRPDFTHQLYVGCGKAIAKSYPTLAPLCPNSHHVGLPWFDVGL